MIFFLDLDNWIVAFDLDDKITNQLTKDWLCHVVYNYIYMFDYFLKEYLDLQHVNFYYDYEQDFII